MKKVMFWYQVEKSPLLEGEVESVESGLGNGIMVDCM